MCYRGTSVVLVLINAFVQASFAVTLAAIFINATQANGTYENVQCLNIPPYTGACNITEGQCLANHVSAQSSVFNTPFNLLVFTIGVCVLMIFLGVMIAVHDIALVCRFCEPMTQRTRGSNKREPIIYDRKLVPFVMVIFFVSVAVALAAIAAFILLAALGLYSESLITDGCTCDCNFLLPISNRVSIGLSCLMTAFNALLLAFTKARQGFPVCCVKAMQDCWLQPRRPFLMSVQFNVAFEHVEFLDDTNPALVNSDAFVEHELLIESKDARLRRQEKELEQELDDEKDQEKDQQLDDEKDV